MTLPPAIVIDNGTGMMKVGFAGSESPRSIFPTIIGTPNSTQQMVGGQNKDFFVGYEAVAKKDLLNLHYPLDDGIINNWEDIERIWHHCFYDELHVVPEDYPVLLTEKPLNLRSHREKTIQIMFETFKVKAFYSTIQQVLALFSLGRTTGVVWDAGEGVSHTLSIYEGYGLPHAISRSQISGTLLSQYLKNMLIKHGQPEYALDDSTVSSIKENLCQVALDYQAAKQEADAPVQIHMTDGTVITVGTERIKCPEVLFNPKKLESMGINSAPIHKSIQDSIMKCEPDINPELYANIVLAGGTTMFHGLPERLEKEIVAQAQPALKVHVIATPSRKNAVWIGGSILASLEAFPEMSITMAQYKEEGASLIHRKCYV